MKTLILNIMNAYKKTILIASLSLCLGLAPASAQKGGVTLNAANVTVKQAMGQLQKSTGYTFVFSSTDVDTNHKVTVNANSSDINDVIRQILKGQDDVTYSISLENDGEPEVYPGKPEATE